MAGTRAPSLLLASLLVLALLGHLRMQLDVHVLGLHNADGARDMPQASTAADPQPVHGERPAHHVAHTGQGCIAFRDRPHGEPVDPPLQAGRSDAVPDSSASHQVPGWPPAEWVPPRTPVGDGVVLLT